MRDALAAHVARLAVVTNEIFGTCDLVSYAWWLGLEIDTDDRDNLDEIALEVYIKSKISALADPHCALLAAIAADCEHLLDQPDAWRPGVLRAGSDCGLGVGGWLALVSRMSYRWTPWESRRLAAAEARCGVATGASSR